MSDSLSAEERKFQYHLNWANPQIREIFRNLGIIYTGEADIIRVFAEAEELPPEDRLYILLSIYDGYVSSIGKNPSETIEKEIGTYARDIILSEIEGEEKKKSWAERLYGEGLKSPAADIFYRIGERERARRISDELARMGQLPENAAERFEIATNMMLRKALYQFSLGEPEDIVKAAKYFEKAAEFVSSDDVKETLRFISGALKRCKAIESTDEQLGDEEGTGYKS
jgi:hypothetical protein